MKKPLTFALLLAAAAAARAQSAGPAPAWPPLTPQHRPWTRWWWQGSAVNPTDLTQLLTQYRQAGLGGVEITSIYGVKGVESQFIDFLSPKWVDALAHTLAEGKRLDLGVDVAQASGWPFGGPWVTPADACKYVAWQTYPVAAGQRLAELVRYLQKPLATAIGHKVDIRDLKDPVAANPNLQALALEQVRFEKLLPLQALMAYPDKGGPALDLTSRVNAAGQLDWTAPAGGGGYTLWAVFQGWHGKQVERAGPGGEGDVIDHFSKAATEHYLQRFDQAFAGRDVRGVRAYFNDSYEVDDAQGEANWTPLLFEEFQRRRGYDLRQHLPALLGKTDADEPRRVLTDYRETISELLLENYTRAWADWAHRRGALIRNQAHGSPANILDLYAVTDIPETEGENLTRIKFASSAAHVAGKPLASAETATWENDHFLSTLADVKKAVDRMLLGGVNHVFYHGTAYSPAAAAWPGWLFYAAVEFNPQNPFWQDFGQLNQYAARCQSFLQAGEPGNDVLLYLPQYDAYQRPGKVLLQHFDGIEHGFRGLPVEATSEALLRQGYGYDFISDRQLQQVQAGAGGELRTGGGARYRTVLVPAARTLPLATWQHLLALARAGATVAVQGALPTGVPGLADLARRQAAFQQVSAQLRFRLGAGGTQRAAVGRGAFVLGSDLGPLLTQAGVTRETLVDQGGLQCIRRRTAQGYTYFLANWGEQPLAAWVPLATAARSAALYDPMTGQLGAAALRQAGGRAEVYVQLPPGGTCLVDTRTSGATPGPAYAYQQPAGAAQPLPGPWAVRFVSGGPELPAALPAVAALASWTTLAGEPGQRFAGTATYTTTFARPAGPAPAAYRLSLGQVAQSARVQLNGRDLGTLIGPGFEVLVPAGQVQASNTLVVSVSNLMANRVAAMDRAGQEWRTFYNVNMAAKLKENRGTDGLFTAAQWQPLPAGLLGPVTLTPVALGSEAVGTR